MTASIAQFSDFIQATTATLQAGNGFDVSDAERTTERLKILANDLASELGAESRIWVQGTRMTGKITYINMYDATVIKYLIWI